MNIDPSSLKPRDRYGLMISLIQPRPIAWVSTVDGAGRRNLAPFSFFTGITSNPMTVCFAPAIDRDGQKKDTLLNIEETRQFVINMASEASGEKMVRTSAPYERGVDEFEMAGLTPVASEAVRPPRVKESPVSLECQLDRVLSIGEGPGSGNLVIGRVLRIHIDDDCWKDGKVSHQDLRPLGRLEGDWYCRVSDDLRIPLPKD